MTEPEPVRPEVVTTNDFMLGYGENLSNHTQTMRGRGKYVKQGMPGPVTFRTKQEVYRFAAWAMTMGDAMLPDEDGEHTFEEVLDAVQK